MLFLERKSITDCQKSLVPRPFAERKVFAGGSASRASGGKNVICQRVRGSHSRTRSFARPAGREPFCRKTQFFDKLSCFFLKEKASKRTSLRYAESRRHAEKHANTTTTAGICKEPFGRRHKTTMVTPLLCRSRSVSRRSSSQAAKAASVAGSKMENSSPGIKSRMRPQRFCSVR